MSTPQPSRRPRWTMRPEFFQFEISRSQAGQRLDRILASALGWDRGTVVEVLAAGAVFVNGRRTTHGARTLRVGDRLRTPRSLPAVPKIDLVGRVIHRDRHLLVVDKPAGVASAPTPQGARGTLPALLAEQLGLARPPTVVHRLDRDVSGVLALALSRVGARTLTAAFESRRARKWYRAWVAGAPAPPEGRIEEPLGRDPTRRGRMRVTAGGDPARTDYRVLEPASATRSFSELTVRIHTGRTHQIRVHLAHLGCPILGDRWYGGPRAVTVEGTRRPVPRLCLHAERLELPRGEGADSGERMTFEAAVPAFLELPGSP